MRFTVGYYIWLAAQWRIAAAQLGWIKCLKQDNDLYVFFRNVTYYEQCWTRVEHNKQLHARQPNMKNVRAAYGFNQSPGKANLLCLYLFSSSVSLCHRGFVCPSSDLVLDPVLWAGCEILMWITRFSYGLMLNWLVVFNELVKICAIQKKKQVNSIQHIRVAVISDVKRPLWNAAEDHFFRTDGRIPHKGESSHLSYATARHQALNLTPMWTRCGVPTAAAAAQQQRYCFNAMTWLNYATTSLCHREKQQSRWTRNAQSSQKDLKL